MKTIQKRYKNKGLKMAGVIILTGLALGVILTNLLIGSITGSKWIDKVEAQGGAALLPEAEADYRDRLAFELGLMDEQQLITFMHKMTHQKIEASDKWGAERMDQVTIEEVLKKIGESNYPNKWTLREIAERWEDGDFSMVDKDHNQFWEMQSGNIGKAKGILSPAEEQKFIDNNF